MRKQDYIIERYTEKYGWCLECIVGPHNAEEVKQKLESENPNEKYKITILSEEETKNAWWNNGVD